MVAHARGPVPAGIYHVGTRSAGPAVLFRDDVDRTHFCNLLVRRLARSEWRCLAFCLMSTHYHLLLAVPDESLQDGMRCLNGHYAFAFNHRHGRNGHLFGNRYFSRAVLTEASLRRRFRYVVRNPVEAGYCASPLDHHWSSYRDLVTGSRVFPFVDHGPILDVFGGDTPEARELIREYSEVAAALDLAA